MDKKSENLEKLAYEDIKYEEVYIRYIRNVNIGDIKMVETEKKIVQKLPEILKKKDGIFILKRREGKFAIYQKIASFDGEILYHHFEVIEIRMIEAIDKSAVDFIEIYPSANEFGIFAWVYHTKEGAYYKFKSFLKKENESRGGDTEVSLLEKNKTQSFQEFKKSLEGERA